MRKAIAIDFDGCLCANAYPAIGEPNWPVIDRAKREQQAGAGLILWTCREGQLLQEAVAACERWGLTFDAVNESLPDWIEAFGTTPRKVGASEYWDDKAVRLPDVPPPNDPLSLEELREMGLMEWLWVEIIQPTKGMSRMSFLGIKSAYYQIFEDYTNGEAFCCGWPGQYGVKHEFEYDNYGKTWLAYRRKPEEVES